MSINLSGHFLLRKLHSLTGVLPIGIFLLEHLYTNSKALGGPTSFNQAVYDLQQIPYIVYIEAFGIWLPILFHGIYGLVITYQASPNNVTYNYARNWMYTLQRISGIILFFFITFHVLNFRFGAIPGLNETSVAHHPYQAWSIVSREFNIPWVLAIYVIGVSATIFHFANGLWNFGLTWGITVGPRAQRVSGIVCSVIGFVLLIVAIRAMFAFVHLGGD